MIAPSVPFDEIREAHLQALIDNGYSERQTVEYKRELPSATDSDKKEFLADASSFANASGGDLLFGIEAKDGVPIRIAPLTGTPDAEKLAWESSLRDGVSPRVPGVQVREIPVEGGYVLLFRIPKSWAGPHAVTYKGSFRFHARTSAGKYVLDVGQLRAAFLGGNELARQLRNFQTERLAQIAAGETPVSLQPNPKIVVHLVPYEAFGAPPSLDLNAAGNDGVFRPPFDNYGTTRRWNIDGLLAYDRLSNDEPAFAYAQLFRSGIYEGVDASAIPAGTDPQYGSPIVYGEWMETALNNLIDPFQVLQRIGAQPPIVILISVIGLKDYRMLIGQRHFSRGDTRIDRDMLILPEVILDQHLVDARAELQHLMRPIVDAFWQAGGFPGSQNYDEEGIWRGIR